MKMSGRILVVMLFGAMAFVASCGGSSGGGGGTDVPSITGIADLPKATSPMASTSADISKDVAKAALTGLNLATTTQDSFSAQSSRGACETLNQLRQGVKAAANSDKILCYVGNMQSSFEAAGLGNINVFDGAWHVFNLDMVQCDEDRHCEGMGGGEGAATCVNNVCMRDGQPTGGAPDRVKMRIHKTAAGSIDSFEMFMCVRSGDTLTQNEYARETIDGAAFAMRGLGMHSGGGGSGWHFVEASGTLNADNAFTEKSITIKDVSSGNGGGSHNSNGTITQTPAAFTFSGFEYGGFDDGSNSGEYENRAYSLGQMLGDTARDAIRMLAMGDGAVHFFSGGTFNGETHSSGDQGEAWDGDTALRVETNEYLATALEVTPPTKEEVSISFASDETWDCTDDVGVGIVDLPETSEPALKELCADYELERDWINCYKAIENPEGGGGGGGNGCNEAMCDQFVAFGAGVVDQCKACLVEASPYDCIHEHICDNAGENHGDCLNAVAACQQ